MKTIQHEDNYLDRMVLQSSMDQINQVLSQHQNFITKRKNLVSETNTFTEKSPPLTVWVTPTHFVGHKRFPDMLTSS